MEGKIEFHGAKQMFVSGDVVFQINSTNFITGDRVLFKTKDDIILLKRQEQCVIGIVKNLYNNFAYLHIVNFPLVCKYSPKISNVENTYKIDDRLVVWLNSDGSIEVKNKYTMENVDDVKCLLDMYCQMPSNMLNENVEYKKGNHLYTKDEIINHND